MEEGAGEYPGEIELRFIQELEDWILGRGGCLGPSTKLGDGGGG